MAEAPLAMLYELTLEGAPDAELMEAIRDGIAASRGSPGNLAYRMFRDENRPSLLILYERWAGRTAFEDHRRSPRYLAMRAAIDEVMPGGLRNHTRITEVDEFEDGAWDGAEAGVGAPTPGGSGAAA